MVGLCRRGLALVRNVACCNDKYVFRKRINEPNHLSRSKALPICSIRQISTSINAEDHEI